MSPTFVATIDPSLEEKLRQDLATQGFVFTKPPYTLFSAQKKGVSCTLYTSGKLTVQGKDKAEFITFYLEPEILQSVAFSYPEVSVDFTARIGIDEAGKGDFFGPLCIAGVQADEAGIRELLKMGVKDSKQMTDPRITLLAKQIKEKFPFSLIRLMPRKYNELYGKFHNLNRLLAWGYATAIEVLMKKTGCTTALIDQFTKAPLVEQMLQQKKLNPHFTKKTHAEADPVVAAASLLARASFVEGIEILSKQWEITLPKGANSHIKVVARQLVQKHGKAALEDVAKLHFKTTSEVLATPI